VCFIVPASMIIIYYIIKKTTCVRDHRCTQMTVPHKIIIFLFFRFGHRYAKSYNDAINESTEFSCLKIKNRAFYYYYDISSHQNPRKWQQILYINIDELYTCMESAIMLFFSRRFRIIIKMAGFHSNQKNGDVTSFLINILMNNHIRWIVH